MKKIGQFLIINGEIKGFIVAIDTFCLDPWYYLVLNENDWEVI